MVMSPGDASLRLPQTGSCACEDRRPRSRAPARRGVVRPVHARVPAPQPTRLPANGLASSSQTAHQYRGCANPFTARRSQSRIRPGARGGARIPRRRRALDRRVRRRWAPLRTPPSRPRGRSARPTHIGCLCPGFFLSDDACLNAASACRKRRSSTSVGQQSFNHAPKAGLPRLPSEIRIRSA